MFLVISPCLFFPQAEHALRALRDRPRDKALGKALAAAMAAPGANATAALAWRFVLDAEEEEDGIVDLHNKAEDEEDDEDSEDGAAAFRSAVIAALGRCGAPACQAALMAAVHDARAQRPGGRSAVGRECLLALTMVRRPSPALVLGLEAFATAANVTAATGAATAGLGSAGLSELQHQALLTLGAVLRADAAARSHASREAGDHSPEARRCVERPTLVEVFQFFLRLSCDRC